MLSGTNYLHEVQAEVFKAIGHPIRLSIVKILTQGELAVTEIVKRVGAEQSNVSRHLALLKQAGVLDSRKAGLKVIYRISSSSFSEDLKVVLARIEQHAAQAAARYNAGAQPGAARSAGSL